HTSYTIYTLIQLAEKYTPKESTLIIGENNRSDFQNWKNADILPRDYLINVYPRPSYDRGKLQAHPSITITETPVMELSATFVREAVKAGKSIQFYVPDKVIEFIDKKGLYLR